MKNRIDQLQDFIKEDPDDPVLRYLLALEYRSSDPRRSRDLFLQLLEHHPEYLPVYYITAELLLELDEKDQARELIRRGITKAEMNGDHKTSTELKNLEENNLT